MLPIKGIKFFFKIVIEASEGIGPSKLIDAYPSLSVNDSYTLFSSTYKTTLASDTGFISESKRLNSKKGFNCYPR